MQGANPYIYEDGTTDAERYLQGCLDGKYVVGETMMKLAKKMLKQIKEGYQGFHYDPDAATRPVEWIETFCMLSSGKLGVPFILEPYERNIIELIFGFVDDNGLRRFQEALIVIGRKNGKACTLSTQLPTPKGWRTMGEIHPGDYVFGQDGKPSLVIAESEIFDKPTYRVTFEDGATVDTSGDHIWTVQTKKSREVAKYVPKTGRRYTDYREGGWFETTTKEMLDSGIYHARRDGKGKEYKYRVPMALPVEYEEKFLPIDPYTFGYWLGDGHSNGPYMTVGKQDLDESIGLLEEFGHTCSVRLGHENTYRVTLDTQSGKKANPFTSALRDMFVLNNKHIPDMYLQASVEQRWELLRGLMDTDGYVSKAGQCQFVQKRKELTEQFVELCSSLGIKANLHEKNATCNGKDCGIVYVVEFWTDKDHSCFHLKRKHARLKDKLADRMKCKSIVSIERIPNEPTKCIAIDNPSHLYLAGRQYTATHNTELCAALNLYMLTSDGEGAPQCYNCATNESQASLCFGATWRMVTQSKKLSKYIKKGMVTERKAVGLKYAPNLGYLVTLSRNADTLDGLNCHYAVLDELAAMRDRSTYDLLKGSLGSQDQPLVFCITTNGRVRDNIFDKQREYALKWLDDRIEDPRFIGILYEMDSREEVEDEAMWPKANPGLGTVKKWDYMRGEMTKARNDPSYRPEIMTKQFNLPANQSAAFLTWEAATCDVDWHYDHQDFKYAVVGMDAADGVDLSAATALMMKPDDDHIYRKSMYWIPEEKLKEGDRANMQGGDHLPYREWEANGWLRVVPGNHVPKTVFLEFIQELADEGVYCRAIGYDQWHMQEIEQQMKYLVGEQNVVRVPQWPKNLSDPMKRMRADLEAGRIVWENPIDTVCNLNVSVSVDANDNYMPVKKGRRSSNRIDGFMSLLDAYIVLMQRYDDYQVAIS